MQRKITIGVGAGIGLISAALINLTSAYQPLLLGLLGMGIFIVCWETAPSIADRIRAEGPEKERKVLPIVIMAFGGVLFATGAIWYHVGHPALVKVTDVGPSGGPGGKAQADSGAKAIGGKGGTTGDIGAGGPGGDANASGPGSFALGGEGGEGARSDRAAKGGRGPFDVLNDPRRDEIVPGTNMRLGDFGRGGDGAPPPKPK